MYQAELDNSNKTICKAAEIIQENFLLLRSMGEVDNSLFQKLVAIGKLMSGRRTVKFYEQEAAAANESVMQADAPESVTVNNMMNLTDDLGNLTDGQSPMSMKKRFNDLNGGDSEHENESKKAKSADEPEPFQFPQPKAVKSINFNAVAPKASTHDLNITFDLNAVPAAEPKVLSEKLNKPSSSSSSASSTSSAASKGEKFLQLIRFCCTI